MRTISKVRVQGERLEDSVRLLSDLLTKRGKERFLKAIGDALIEDGTATIDTRDMSVLFREAFIKAGRAQSSTDRLIKDFDPTSFRAVRKMRSLGADLVKANDEVRDSIRIITARGIGDGLTHDQIAKNIEQIIGLTPRHTLAVDNYRKSLTGQGISPGRVNQMTGEYADRLRASRAETIARTEVQKAVEAAKLEYWEQAADLGVIQRGEAWRIWKLDPDCKHCRWCPPLEGKKARIGGVWYSKIGKVEHPPLHPNCCCSVELDAPVHGGDAHARR